MSITSKCIYLAIVVMAAIAVSALTTAAKDKSDIMDQKRELEQINEEIEDSQRRLDSLQATQKSLQSRISDYDQKISSDRKVIRRLTRELDELNAAIAEADSLQQERRLYLDRCQRRYLGNIRYFYMAANEPPPVISDRPNAELDLHRKVVYLTALAGYESGNVQEASVLLNESVAQLEDVTGRSKMVRGLKKDRETSYALGTSQKQQQEKKLDQVRRKSLVEADRQITLQQAAEEMASIVARLERERTATTSRRPARRGESVFATLKGRLPSPFRGKIVTAFGPSKDRVTGLRSYSPGIAIKGRSGNSVYAVGAGTVAMTGKLRGYGNFVIINHDGEYYTTYAGLGSVLVAENQYLQTRSKVGTAGDDGIVKFELRKGREPLDPVKWISIESF
ncbi:peptidoglycan DD-metalloendopeptidase family protein [candidate division GN15 bacterium]|nr:peptidoglycan DD-metalloendopeptidase family protein [candidate division GN15 bacterium]